MSRVFLAEDIKLRRQVVIKVLPPEMAPANAERFNREIELAAQLQHPHIVPLLTTDSVDGLMYYTMPFVSGESLSDRLAREGALPLEDALRIWRDVLDAIAHAHASGVIHRDIKPGNILLTGRHALVTDFGISRAIETAAGDVSASAPGPLIGTPAYIAPEDAAGEREADHRADIYQAGLVMYEMLAGNPPFVAGSASEYLEAHRAHEPPPLLSPSAPQNLLALVMRCLAKDPAERPQSADTVLSELHTLATETPQSTVRGKRAHGLRRVAPYAIAALLLVAVVSIAIGLRQEAPAITDATVGPPTIAVLPWTESSTDPADAALADGMTQELTATLGRSTGLHVIPGTPVPFQGRGSDMRQLADSFHISHVLEGNLQKAGSNVHIQVRLVNTQDGSTSWSESYKGEFADVFDVQEDIARAIARELEVQFSGRKHAGPMARRHTPDIVAYEWYVRGMGWPLMRSPSGRRQAVDYFRRAISIDSMYADAYAGLARLCVSISGSAPDTARSEWLELARQSALKAVALDDGNAFGRSALGWVHALSWDYRAAETEFKRAIALDPNVKRGHEGLARVYMFTGRPAEQLAEAWLGRYADPFSHSAIRELALALATNGRCEESLEQLRPLKTLSPPARVAGVLMGLCYASREMWPEAIAEFRWASENPGTGMAGRALLGHALARAGRTGEAAGILSDLLAGREYSHGAWGIAVVYAGMRDYDRAFAWLDKSVEDHTIHTTYMMHPLFDNLRRDRRFDGVRERIGLKER